VLTEVEMPTNERVTSEDYFVDCDECIRFKVNCMTHINGLLVLNENNSFYILERFSHTKSVYNLLKITLFKFTCLLAIPA
jgi:hypothetical protein